MGINVAASQKLVRKSIIDQRIELIQIDAVNCFAVQIETSGSEEMKVEAVIDGEYKNDLMLNLEPKGTSIHVSTTFAPSFKNPNDKLSAHKVVSIALQVFVPENQNVQVNGTSCNVTAKGNYDSLNVTLNDGNCVLKEVSKMAEVRTHSGDIKIYSSEARINALSKYGKVTKNEIPFGKNDFNLVTTTGNINLTFTEKANNN